MSSQAFLWIQLLLGSALLVLFLWRRAQRQPTKLNMRSGEGERRGNGPVREGNPRIPVVRDRAAAERRRSAAMSPEVLQATTVGREKTLNILFNHNGHTWDAYEILGIPAGAPPALVESAYRNLLAKTAPESREFVDAAYNAIKTARSA